MVNVVLTLYCHYYIMIKTILSTASMTLGHSVLYFSGLISIMSEFSY